MSRLSIHDTMAGRVVEFMPAGDTVTMYVCGPTVYGGPHVGNARPVVVFDVLYRLLRHVFGEVRYARNITDIDDKIIAAARGAGVGPAELAREHEAEFRDMAAKLGCLPPDHEPRATEHIGAMAEMASELIKRGHAYEAEGHVLFAVGSFERYGALSNRSRDDMVAGARVEVAPYKRDPADFVLWKPAAEGEPGWPSPWGRGRPGWHLECSTMIRSCLGDTIDIHGGGQDLAFPHHENEIAQSCCATGSKQLARHWMHNGHVTADGRKMSKSAGNFSLLGDALGRYDGETVRYALLGAHYRSPLEWGRGMLDAAEHSLSRLYRALAATDDKVPEADCPGEFLDAVCADLNTPRALAMLHEYAARANKDDDDGARARLAAAGRLVGLLGKSPADWARGADGSLDVVLVERLVSERDAARSSGDYDLADSLRGRLEREGVIIEDTAQGTKWRLR